MKKLIFLFCFVGTALAQTPATDKTKADANLIPDPQPKEVVVTVNDEKVTFQEVDIASKRNPLYGFYFKTSKGNMAPIHQFRRMVLDNMVGQILLAQECDRRKLLSPSELKQKLEKVITAQGGNAKLENNLKTMKLSVQDYINGLSRDIKIQALVENGLVPNIVISEEELRAIYNKNPHSWEQPEKVHARHILIKLNEKPTAEQEKAAKEKAEAVYVELLKPQVIFNDMAKKHSQDPATAMRGGDLHFIRREQFTPEFDDIVFKLKVGEFSKPFKTDRGYQIVKVEERQEGKPNTFENAQDRIRSQILNTRKQQAQKALLEELRNKAKITYTNVAPYLIKVRPTPVATTGKS